MSNPYQSTSQIPSRSRSRDRAKSEVSGPAIGLIVVSSIGIAFGLLGLAGDAFLILSGMVDRLEAMNDSPISEYTQITIRTIWGIILLLAASFVLYGAVKMKTMKNYGAARAASIVAFIPLLGPCCILGIPFGIWAFVVLGRPYVKDGFR